MQPIYTTCDLPSNGMFYPIKQVRIRPKTIYDIKTMLNNPVFMLRNEIDALQACIHPDDAKKVNVYDLVNQDVVYLLYMLRSLSDDSIELEIKGQKFVVKISELDVVTLDHWDNVVTLPECGKTVQLNYTPIKNIFDLPQMVEEFKRNYPDFASDPANAVALLNAVALFDNHANRDIVRSALEELSWKDSIYLVQKIEENSKLQFGVKEEATITLDGVEVVIPLKITEEFFRPAL